VAAVPLRADELRDRMDDPAWREATVVDGESPLVLVDARDPALAHVDGLRPQWRIIAAVAPDDGTSPWFADVVVTADDVAALEQSCSATPLAAATLVQVLRAGEGLDIGDALVLESLAYSTLLAGPEFGRWQAGQPPREPKPADEPVLVEPDGDTWHVVLNRPDARNAYSAALRDALVEVLRAAASMDSPPAVVLRGNGPSFSAGGDLAEFGVTPDPVLAHGIRTARAPGPLLHRLGATARIHGPCVGAGVELAAFCTRVEAAADTTLMLPEVAMGLIPGAGGTVSVARRIGRQRTALFALTGTTIDAPAALAWGLVDAVTG
jgi:hypothetical protein